MNWFYESAGKQQGPVSEADLDRLLAEGTITPATLVWREGLTDWQPLGKARPAAPPLSAVAGTSGEVVVCASCGRLFPSSDVIQIGGRPICSDCKPTVLQGLQQGGDLPAMADHERTGPAWEHRAQLGIVAAAWATMRDVFSKPGEVFARMKREGGVGGPLFYCVLIGTIGNLFYVGYQLLIQMSGLAVAGQGTEGANPFLAMMFTGAGIGLMTLFIPFFIVAGAFVYSGILHLSLMICGGAKQPFETTFRVQCYAAGSASALMVIPICGGIIGGIWSVVATIIGLAKAHEIGTGRAVWAVFLPLIFCCVTAFAVAMVIGGLAGAAGAAGITPQP